MSFLNQRSRGSLGAIRGWSTSSACDAAGTAYPIVEVIDPSEPTLLTFRARNPTAVNEVLLMVRHVVATSLGNIA